MKRSLDSINPNYDQPCKIFRTQDNLFLKKEIKNQLRNALILFNPNFHWNYDHTLKYELFVYPIEKIYYHFLEVLGLYSTDSVEYLIWRLPFVTTTIKTKIFDYMFSITDKDKNILDLWTTKSRWVNHFRLELVYYSHAIDKLFNNNFDSEKNMEYRVKLDELITPFLGLHFDNIDWMLSANRVMNEFNDPSMWKFLDNFSDPIELDKLIDKYSNFFSKLYPTIESTEKFRHKIIDMLCRHLCTTANTDFIYDTNYLKNMEIIAILFENYLRTSGLSENANKSFILELVSHLFDFDNPIITICTCYSICYIISSPEYSQFLNLDAKTTINKKLVKLLAHHSWPGNTINAARSSDINIAASLSLTLLVSNWKINVSKNIAHIFELLSHENENVISFVVSIIATVEGASNIFKKLTQNVANIDFPNPIPFIFSLMKNRQVLTPKIIQSCLWCLIFSFSKRKVDILFEPLHCIPDEITRYVDIELFRDPIFMPYTDTIIMFACQCVAALTVIPNGPNRYTVDDALLVKISSLVNSGSENIVIWTCRYLATLSNISMTYNKNTRESIIKFHLDPIINLLTSCNIRILETALWCIYKIAKNNTQAISLIRTSLEKIFPRHEHITIFFNHASHEIIRAQCLCFELLAIRDQLPIAITQILDIIEKYSSFPNDSGILLSTYTCLNKLTHKNNENWIYNCELIGIRGIKLLLSHLNLPGMVEIVCRCLGNLARYSPYLSYYNDIIPQILHFLKSPNLKIVDAACIVLYNSISNLSVHQELDWFKMDGFQNIVGFVVSYLEKEKIYRHFEKVIETFLRIIKIFCNIEHYGDLVTQFNIFPRIIMFLDHSSNIIVKVACKCFSKLVNKSNLKMAQNMNIINCLDRLLDSNDNKLIIPIIKCLESMSRIAIKFDSNIVMEIGRVTIPKLVDHIHDNDFKEIIYRYLAMLVDINQFLVIENIGLKIFIKALDTQNENIIEYSCTCISSILDVHVHETIFEIATIIKLIILLNSRNSKIVIIACQCLTKLANRCQNMKILMPAYLEYWIALLSPFDYGQLSNLPQNYQIVQDLDNSKEQKDGYLSILEKKVENCILNQTRPIIIFENEKQLITSFQKIQMRSINYHTLIAEHLKKENGLIAMADIFNKSCNPIMTTKIVIKSFLDLSEESWRQQKIHFIQTTLPKSDQEDWMIRGNILQNVSHSHEFHLSLRQISETCDISSTVPQLDHLIIHSYINKWSDENINIIFNALKCIINMYLFNQIEPCNYKLCRILFVRLGLYIGTILSDKKYLNELLQESNESSKNKIYQISLQICLIIRRFVTINGKDNIFGLREILPLLLQLFIIPSTDELTESISETILEFINNDQCLDYISQIFFTLIPSFANNNIAGKSFTNISAIMIKLLYRDDSIWIRLYTYKNISIIQQLHKHRTENKYLVVLWNKMKQDVRVKKYIISQTLPCPQSGLPSIKESHRYWLDLVLITKKDKMANLRKKIFNNFFVLSTDLQFNSLNDNEKFVIVNGYLEAISATIDDYVYQVPGTITHFFSNKDAPMMLNILLPLVGDIKNISKNFSFPININTFVDNLNIYPQYSSCKFFDFTIIMDDGSHIKAHKDILYHSCEYFKLYFDWESRINKVTSTTEIHEVDSDIFQKIIRYFYEHTIILTSVDEVNILLTLATQFQIPLLQQYISEIICITIIPETFFDYLNASIQLSLNTLTHDIIYLWCLNWKFYSEDVKTMFLDRWPEIVQVLESHLSS